MTTVKYTDAPTDVERAMDSAQPVTDFLPSPDQLTLRVRKEKVTMNLDSDVVDYFRRSAEKNRIGYQSLINEVLRVYKDSQTPIRA